MNIVMANWQITSNDLNSLLLTLIVFGQFCYLIIKKKIPFERCILFFVVCLFIILDQVIEIIDGNISFINYTNFLIAPELLLVNKIITIFFTAVIIVLYFQWCVLQEFIRKEFIMHKKMLVLFVTACMILILAVHVFCYFLLFWKINDVLK